MGIHEHSTQINPRSASLASPLLFLFAVRSAPERRIWVPNWVASEELCHQLLSSLRCAGA